MMMKMKRINVKLFLWLLVIIFLSITLIVFSDTLALFESNANGLVNSDTGRWIIKVNNETITEEDVETIVIDDFVYTASSHTAPGVIAPGGSAYFDLVIDATECDVAVKYTLTLNSTTTGYADNIEFSVDGMDEAGIVQTGEFDFTGVIELDDILEGNTKSIRVNVVWNNDEQFNEQDSAIGIVENNKLTFPIGFTAIQYLGEDIENPNFCPRGKYSNTVAGTCENCPSGYTSAAGAATIDRCYIQVEGGKHKTSPNSTSTVNCAVGSYSIGHRSYYGVQDDCTLCDPGTYNTSQGSTSCSICEDGYYCPGAQNRVACQAGKEGTGRGKTDEQSGCSDCPPGSFAQGIGNPACTLCAEGKYSAFTGQTTCSSCDAGRYNIGEGNTSCLICEKGYYCPGGQTRVACAAGKEGTNTGTTSEATGCQNCAVGYFSSTAGTSTCSSCEAGTYTSTAGQTSCTTCQDGYYCPGGQNRVACPAGTEGSGTGKTSESQGCQACAPGRYSTGTGNATCSACTAGTYTSDYGQTSCTTCEDGYYCPGGQNRVGCPAGTEGNGTGRTSESAGCNSCSINTYSNSTGTPTCSSCASGTYNTQTGQTSCSTSPDTICVYNSSRYWSNSNYSSTRYNATYNCPTGNNSASSCTYCDEGSSCTHTNYYHICTKRQ